MTIITEILIITISFCSLCSLTNAESNAPLSEYVSVTGKYLPGPLPQNSVQIERGISLALCAAKCTVYFRRKTFPCYAFEYTPGSKMCVYTNVTTLMINGGFLGLQDNSAINYYERTKGTYSNLFHGTLGVALQDQNSYYDIRYNSTLEKCSFDCLLNYNKTCMSFSFSPRTGVCGLSQTYHSRDNGVALRQTSLYNHYQYYTSWPCNATFPKNYGPRVLASPRFPFKSVNHINCYEKLEAPEGKRIQILFSTLYLKENVCQRQELGITIHDGDSETAPVLGRLCGTSQSVYTRTSSSGSLYLKIKTDDTPLAYKALYNFVEGKRKPENPCVDNKCEHGATCIKKNDSYICACVTGYMGRYCEQDIDECASNPCYFGASCINLLNSYRCQCPQEFSGERCEKFLGACGSNPCQHGACSIIGQTNYSCNCNAEFTGRNCETKLNPCMSNPCFHGNCTNEENGYSCSCQLGYTGINCDEVIDHCATSPCRQGNCSSSLTGYTCTCNQGFKGNNCDTVIDHCDGVNCNNGLCINQKTRFECRCSEGYLGKYCNQTVDHCSPSPCENGGQCINNINGYSCSCREGFTGGRCNVSIDYCSFGPCSHGKCVNTPSGFLCLCEDGYSGIFCNVATCENITCSNHGKCEITLGQPVCNCEASFTGRNCETGIDYCLNADCGFGLCSQSSNGYHCICAEGYTGDNCKDKIVPSQIQTTTSKTIDFCRNVTCKNNGRCHSRENGYDCQCVAPYAGRNCETMKNDCFFSPCYSGSTCVDLNLGNHLCLCPKGMTGDACDVRVNACMSNPCRRGHCKIHGTGYRCVITTLSGTSNATLSEQSNFRTYV